MAFMSTHQQCVRQKGTLSQQFCAVEKGGGKCDSCLDGYGWGLSEVRGNLGAYGSASNGCGCLRSSCCCGERYEDLDSIETHLGQSVCFPSELDDVSIDSLLQNQTDFCLESFVDDVEFKGFLESNFNFNDYLLKDETFKKVEENSVLLSPSLKHDVCTDIEVSSIQPLLFDQLPFQISENNPLSPSDTISASYHQVDDFLGNLSNFDASESFLSSFVDLPESFVDLSSSFEASFVSSESLSFTSMPSSFTHLVTPYSSNSILSSPTQQLPILSSFPSHQPLSSSISLISPLPFQLSSLSQPPSIQSSSYQISLSTPSTLSTPSSSPSSLVHRPEKRLRKMEQNKTAALRYRQKKRKEKGSFMQEFDSIEKRNIELKNKVSEITKEINYLKSLMAEIFAALNKS